MENKAASPQNKDSAASTKSNHENLKIINQAGPNHHEPKIIKPVSNPSLSPASVFKPVLASLIIVIAGVVTGFGLSKVTAKNPSNSGSSSQPGVITTSTQIKEGSIFGSTDQDQFPNEAEGVLVAGGIDGEGSHHLLRPGGPSQNVYLTSTVVDLDLFVNHQIQVRGETYSGQKAGWLMDVGFVKVEKLNAEKPFEEATPDE